MNILTSEFQGNWRSGATVALVNVPLSISFAVAANAPPAMGVTTAIWAALLVPFGSRYNILGPTGALSGLLSTSSLQYGPQVLPFLAIVAGAWCLVFFWLHLDRVCNFIPEAVIRGFTLGVAFIVALNQLPVALGLTDIHRHESLSQATISTFARVDETNALSLCFFLFFLVSVLFLNNQFPNIPWIIIVCFFGILLGAAISNFPSLGLKTIASQYDSQFHFSLLVINRQFFSFTNIYSGASIAMVAMLETLISAKVADNLTGIKHDQRREVLSLGIANIGSGLLGGLPATAALARTALNIRSGATSQMSSFINGIAVIIISFALPLFSYLLLSVVAAVLVATAYDMVDLPALKRVWYEDKQMGLVTLLTALVVVLTDPILGVLLGSLLKRMLKPSSSRVQTPLSSLLVR